MAASLHLSGPVSADVTEVRLQKCATRKSGDFNSFYASAYFSVDGQWYYLQLTGLNPLPVKGSPNGYSGPGSYSALADFRDMKLYPGGMVIGQQAWGVPFDRTATLTVAIGEASVSVGSTISRWSDPNPAMSSSLDLWPQSPDATGPRPAPTPAVEQVEHITGSWFCL